MTVNYKEKYLQGKDERNNSYLYILINNIVWKNKKEKNSFIHLILSSTKLENILSSEFLIFSQKLWK